MFLYMGGVKTVDLSRNAADTSRMNGTKHTMTELIVHDTAMTARP